MDTVNKVTRSRMMSAIRGRDTSPEIAVRRYLHAVGLRFRLGGCGLPGRPDIVLPGRQVAVFVHGCFWHRHSGCGYATHPSTRPEFWQKKFEANVKRDAAVLASLFDAGWKPMTVWECEVRDERALDELTWRILATLPRH